jgi:hypothetical protein
MTVIKIEDITDQCTAEAQPTNSAGSQGDQQECAAEGDSPAAAAEPEGEAQGGQVEPLQTGDASTDQVQHDFGSIGRAWAACSGKSCALTCGTTRLASCRGVWSVQRRLNRRATPCTPLAGCRRRWCVRTWTWVLLIF